MKILRRIAERLARGRVLKRKITVNGKTVSIFVTPDSQLKYLKIGKNAFDSDLISIAESLILKDSVVWDIGSNVGTFTFAAATVADRGTIVSIEPDGWLVTLQRRTALLPDFEMSDVRVIPAAVSNKDSVAEFHVAERGRACNALQEAGGRSQMGGIRERQFVPIITLDTLLRSMPRPDFIKMDIEGAELMALNGATKIIKEIRPVFYIEVGVTNVIDILSLFDTHHYKALNPEGTDFTVGCSPNSFFIPEEKVKIVQSHLK